MNETAHAASAHIDVPYWAWTLLGGAAALLGSKALGFVLDILLVQIKGKNGSQNEVSANQTGQQVLLCSTSCRPQWEGAIATSVGASENRIGVRVDAGFARIHERLDKIMERGD